MFEFFWIKNQALQKHKCQNIDNIIIELLKIPITHLG
jgi:hypothetical protein